MVSFCLLYRQPELLAIVMGVAFTNLLMTLRHSALLCDLRSLTCTQKHCFEEVRQWMIYNKLKLHNNITDWQL